MCDKVKFEITGKPTSMSYCHCSRCRKAAGVFSVVLVGKAEDLRVVQGQEYINKVPPDPKWKFKRCFCKDCGTSLGDLVSGSIYVVAASALDDDPGMTPMFHMHTGSKPAWYEINDDLEKYEADYIPK